METSKLYLRLWLRTKFLNLHIVFIDWMPEIEDSMVEQES